MTPAGITYGYDVAFNLASYCDAGGTVTYAYDPGNRMVGVATGSGSCTSGAILQPCTTYGYNADNKVTTITYPTSTGVTETYGYNKAGKTTSSTAVFSGTTNGADSYTYNYVGAFSSNSSDDYPLMQSSLGGPGAHGLLIYSYDDQDQLTQVAGNAYLLSFSYDNNGN